MCSISAYYISEIKPETSSYVAHTKILFLHNRPVSPLHLNLTMCSVEEVWLGHKLRHMLYLPTLLCSLLCQPIYSIGSHIDCQKEHPFQVLLVADELKKGIHFGTLVARKVM